MCFVGIVVSYVGTGRASGAFFLEESFLSSLTPVNPVVLRYANFLLIRWICFPFQFIFCFLFCCCCHCHWSIFSASACVYAMRKHEKYRNWNRKFSQPFSFILIELTTQIEWKAIEHIEVVILGGWTTNTIWFFWGDHNIFMDIVNCVPLFYCIFFADGEKIGSKLSHLRWIAHYINIII